MVNEAILGALKSALARSESLKKAMMTVYNAGYKREEISEAARLINEGDLSPQVQPIEQANVKQPQQSATAKMLAPSKKLSPKPKQTKQPLKQIQQPPQLQQIQVPQQPPQLQEIQIPPQQVQQPQVTQQPTQQPLPQQQIQQPVANQNTPQKVSVYGQPPEQKSKIMIIVLGFLLLFLIGSLVTIFLFKEELLDFFNNLFS